MLTEIVREAPALPLCRLCGRMARGEVSVVVTAGGNETFTVGLAHPECSRSGVITASAGPAVGMSGAACLRPADGAPVLLLSAHVRILRITEGGDVQDLLLASLLQSGFTLMTRIDQALPTVADLSFSSRWRRILVCDAAGVPLYAGAPGIGQAWAASARAAGRIGVVLAGGLDLRHPRRDPGAGLARAVASGRAVGAAVLAG